MIPHLPARHPSSPSVPGPAEPRLALPLRPIYQPGWVTRERMNRYLRKRNAWRSPLSLGGGGGVDALSYHQKPMHTTLWMQESLVHQRIPEDSGAFPSFAMMDLGAHETGEGVHESQVFVSRVLGLSAEGKTHLGGRVAGDLSLSSSFTGFRGLSSSSRMTFSLPALSTLKSPAGRRRFSQQRKEVDQ